MSNICTCICALSDSIWEEAEGSRCCDIGTPFIQGDGCTNFHLGAVNLHNLRHLELTDTGEMLAITPDGLICGVSEHNISESRMISPGSNLSFSSFIFLIYLAFV